MLDSVAERRLTAILAVDVAGYSANSEIDEAGAVRGVEALSRLVYQQAQTHGGRVFNTAGDGFMLEFPTVSGALAAAGAIAERADPPVRVGAHLGEVAVTPSGDLLGHGVNVAARLQALAKPGSVLASESVRRAATGPERFRRQGRVRLDKMSHRAEVFTLDLAHRPGGIHRRRPWLAPAIAAIAALASAGAGVFIWRQAQPKELRVAIEPIQAEGDDPAVRALVDGMDRRISAGLPDHGTVVVPAEAAASPGRGGARLVVSGQARRIGDTLAVDIQLEDRRGNRLLWMPRFERPVSEAGALAEQIPAKVTDVVTLAVKTLEHPGVASDSRTLGVILRSADISRSGLLKADQLLDADRRLVQLAPRLSDAHAWLAIDLAMSLQGRPPAVAKAMVAEVRAESAEALRLDPHNSEAYASLYQLIPEKDYAQREALLAKALALDPQGPGVNNGMAGLLRDVGRNREAAPIYRRALALDPMSPPRTATLIFGLAGTGRLQESWTLAQRGLALFPDAPSVLKGYAYTAAIYQPPDVALGAIDIIARMGGLLDNGGARAWRDYVNGARRGRIDPAAVRRFKAAALKGLVDPSNAAPALAQAGDVDGAFAVSNKAIDDGVRIYPAELFETAAAPMRRDPRFEALVNRLGILDYWRSSRIPPDFCGEPDPPTICRGLPGKPR